jgi:transglutaminase superfamily protein
MLRRVAILILLATAAATAAAAADDKTEPVLHEYVAPPRGANGRVVTPPAAPGARPTASSATATPPGNPTAIRQNDRILVEPPLAQRPGASEPIHGAGPFAVDRETEARPDYATRQDGTLHYAEVFNPSVVPFKRMSALDAVRSDYTLYDRDTATQEVPVGGQTSSDRDLFWGSLVVTFGPAAERRDVAIPSVAPDMRILSYEVDPPLRLQFAKDGADNFYVRAQDPQRGGRFRVVFLADAPSGYFAPVLPRGYTVGEVAAARAPVPVPARARESAQVVLERLAITRNTPLDDALDRLVDYFRGFQAGEPPAQTDDVYLDLALSRRGVCRHRAFAFMVTANAAGIPTRYVTNEAHAFAEVWVPDRGWLRIDLGGAALRLDVANAADKTLYRPHGEDPFPKPPAYSENYTRFHGVSGLSSDQVDEARRPLDPAHPGSARDPHSTDPVGAPVGARLPRAAPEDTRRAVSVSVDSVDRHAFRGDTIRIAGHVRDGQKEIEGLRVDIYLAAAGSGGYPARLVGQTISSADGFSAAIELPPDLPLGQHEVFAATNGNATYAPGHSE